MESFTVGVTGTGSLIGQAVIKSIKKAPFSNSIRIVGFDYFKNTVGSYWCNENYLLPDLLKAGVEEEWKRSVIDLIKKESIRLLFIGVDFELPVFAKEKEKIEAATGCKVIVSSPEVIEIANDKYLTYQFLRRNGLYCPKTFLPEELPAGGPEYPCIVKPRVGARSRDVYVVKSAADLEDKLKKVDGPIIQEMVGTMADEYTCGVIYLDGPEPEKMIALNRSLKEGNTFQSNFSLSFPGVIYEYLKEVSMKLKPFGSCNFQLRLDKQGIPKIFEINARHSGTTYIRTLFGYKEVEYIIQYMTGARPDDFQLREGSAVRYYDEFFINKVPA